MTTSIAASLCILVLGALVFALASNASAKELGRGAYWIGLFWFVAAIGSHTFRF